MLKGEIALTATRPTSPEPLRRRDRYRGCGALAANLSLTVNQSLVSCDGRFTLRPRR